MKHTRQTTLKTTRIVAIFSLAFAITSCEQKNKKVTPSSAVLNLSPKENLPNTPELVVRTWEENVNKNKFQLPRLISTGDALDLVNSIAGDGKSQQADEVPTEILNISCSAKSDEALCACSMKDDYGKRAFKYFLVKNNGQWLLSKIEDFDDSSTTGIRLNEKPAKTIQ